MRNRWRTGTTTAAAGPAMVVVVGLLATTSCGDDDGGDESTQAVDTGEAVVAAIDERDGEEVDRLLAADATINVFDASTDAELQNILKWLAATDWRFDVQTCGFDPEAAAGWSTACTILERNAWSEALGAEPVDGEFTFRIEDGDVTGVRFRHDTGAIFGQVFSPFANYVRQQSREDDLEMFDSNWWELPDDEVDEVITKWERYTDEFVAAQAGS